jgi:hypothetical protein
MTYAKDTQATTISVYTTVNTEEKKQYLRV